MLVTLIGKNKIYKIALPETPVGSYWISDKNEESEKKLVNIEGRDGNWEIVSSNHVKIIDSKYINDRITKVEDINKKIAYKIILKEYSMYGVCLGDSDELYILYCSPIYEDNFVKLDIKNATQIAIGNNTHNNISYENKMVSDTHARIFNYNGRWNIENFDSNFGTFVNNKPVTNKGVLLSNGDVVFIMGLKLVVMGNSFFVNNPRNNVKFDSGTFAIPKKTNEVLKDDKEEENNLKVYEEEDYFSRAPRIINVIEKEKVKIDAPPQIQDKENTPFILVMGTSLTMSAMMIVSLINAIDGKISGTASTKQTAFSVITSLTMLIGMLVFPVLNQKYERKKKRKYEEKRQKRYMEYLNSKKETINKIMNKQRNILFENYLSAEECTKVILEKNSRLWERKIEDYDFLSVRLGIGDVPLDIDIQYPEERFSMEDDNLVEVLNDIAANSKTIKNAPIALPLAEKNVSALIVKENEIAQKYIQDLIIQLIAFQSYEDLKLVFLLKEDKLKKWQYAKTLPHAWNNTKQIRFFADNYDDMKEISSYLEEELQHRLQYRDKDYKSFMPYYLIITDDYKKIENLKIIKEVLKTKVNVGFSILCITSDLMQLPNECKTFVNIEDKTGMLFENEISSNSQREITFDNSVTFFFEKLCQAISNIPIRYTASENALLPNSYTFLEMYDAGCIEQLNILERWNRNNPILSLKTPIGIDAAGMPISLDIHEKFHGPHGLIAGSTGSGKSEFIITYILSLAINYHPDDVTFILIDYKGGGLAGAFEKRKVRLPHLVGTITNIDTNGLKRSLASIQSELRRRQVVFNEVRNMTDEGIIDIYKYQKLYHDGVVAEPIPHLLIICDEFAELKQQQPEFMEELMSVSRIGRSLGVHLILATQKPAGIVNDQIRSNSKFAVCLKVQEKEDSNDVIRRPDAASLKKAGQFFMQVGNDDYFVLGQSAWAGAPYFPSNITEKKEDNSIEFISNVGTIIKKVDDASQKIVSNKGEQLTNIVRYIYEIAEQEKIKTKKLWLDDIPETIFVKQLNKKYNVKVQKNNINPTIGEFDDPNNQRQGIVSMNLSEQGNTIIYGNAESGKETLLSTMVYDLITTHSVEEVQLYLLDFGTEALKIYRDAPHVGDVIFINDTEKISRFFDFIQNQIKERKEILSDYGGDYNLYLKTSGKPMPTIVVAINSFETFSENYENEYEDLFLTISREGLKCGIVFVTTASSYNTMRYRLSQNFKQKIALQLNNEDDYFNIFDRVGKIRPSHIFGRGLICLENDEIYEFQTAKICDPEQYNIHIREVIQELNKTSLQMARPIPVMPDRVTIESVKEYLKDISTLPIGIAKKDLKVFKYDFRREFINIITSMNMEDAGEFIKHIIEELKILKNLNVKILDAERILTTKKTDLKGEYINFISELEHNSKKNSLCIIIGVDKFVSDFDDMNSNLFTTFYSTLKKAEEYGNCNYILVENANKLKNYEYNEWYKNYVSKDNAIWIGNGIDNQYLININSERRKIVNNCGRTYGYAIKQGILNLIKLLGMKEDGDENE